VYPSLSATSCGIIPDREETSDSPKQDWVLAQGQSCGECQWLKSDIYLSLSIWHSTSITNNPRENLLSEAFSLTKLSFTIFILPELFTLSLSSTLSLV